jgi:cell division protein FtsQ
MKNLFKILSWVVVLAGISVIFGFALIEQRNIKCNDLTVNITDGNERGFIDADDIKQMIISRFDSLQGRPIDSLDTEGMEQMLENNAYVKNVKVYTSLTGRLNIEVERQKPLVRIVNRHGESFYVSATGRIMPLSTRYVPHVIIASGNINERFADLKNTNMTDTAAGKNGNGQVKMLYLLANAIGSNAFMDEHISQIYVNGNGEFELIPDKGNYTILLGDVSDVERKFENFQAFYLKGLPKTDAGKMKVVNLKYKDMVVCK